MSVAAASDRRRDGGNSDRQQIENLPLNGRDYLQLAALSSGTIPSTSGVGISIGGQGGGRLLHSCLMEWTTTARLSFPRTEIRRR